MREVVTPKGSRFLLCQRSLTEPDYPKYPPQPVLRCFGHKLADEPTEPSRTGSRPS